jgi:hypothetical protein
MIEQTVNDLTTIIENTAGVSRVGRLTGNDLPSPTATRAAAGAAQGAVTAGTVRTRA